MDKYIIVCCFIIGMMLWIIPLSSYLTPYIGQQDTITYKTSKFEFNVIYVTDNTNVTYIVNGCEGSLLRDYISGIKVNDTINIRHGLLDYNSIILDMSCDSLL